MFDTYVTYITHVESLTQTDSQSQKHAELSGFHKC